jgi:vacuolar-type H+-ATPase subunit C/Vma6
VSAKRASKYAQVSASVRAMKSRMFGENDYERLLRCSTLPECLSILQENDYFQGTVTAAEMADPTSWQKLSDAKMIAVVHKLANLSPDDCARVLVAFEGQHRLEYLKAGLRLMVAKESKELQSDAFLGEYVDDSLRSAAETRNVERLVQAADAPSVYGEISSALAEKRPLPLVEAIVDRYGLLRTWAAADMPEWMDKESVRGLVGEQIDMTNMLLVGRSKVLGVSGEELQQILVPVDYHLGGTLPDAASAGSATNALRTFAKTAYRSSIERFFDTFKEGDSLHPLEVSLRRHHANSCLAVFGGFPFHAGLPLAFAYLTAYELSDVSSIVSAKRDGIPIERTQQFLVLQKVL